MKTRKYVNIIQKKSTLNVAFFFLNDFNQTTNSFIGKIMQGKHQSKRIILIIIIKKIKIT